MSIHPARYWRNLISRELRRNNPGIEDEKHFHDYVQQTYLHEKEHLAQLAGKPDYEVEMSGVQLTIYLFAIMLLTYGDLNVVDDILKYLPGDRHPARSLARSIQTLLPLDQNYDVLARPVDISKWVKAHRSRLVWDEISGRFILDSDETKHE